MISIDDFKLILTDTLQHEGKTSVDPADPGNWTGGKVGNGELRGTKKGISAARYPHLDVMALSDEQIEKLYFDDFWSGPRINHLDNFALARKVFDLYVNTGQAIRMLQRAINTVCCGQVAPRRAAPWRQTVARLTKGKPLRVDGIIGPITLEVLRACPYQAALRVALKGEAYNHYKRRNPLYIPGWLTRLAG
ncbi:MAG: hypothetical protein C0622_05235 [Desulfuromonas sp.]|nr:MAG: hypothetical protein C0622_05235 [Desulfuromonas sp.]